MPLLLEAGLVIRYDFLWDKEAKAGHEDGKDRPCAVVLMSKEREDLSRDVYVCAITHTPPLQGETALEIPYKVCQHLGLDERRMWIKTHEVNSFQWNGDVIPCGVTRTPSGAWSYGLLPKALGQEAMQQVRQNSQQHALSIIKREASSQEAKPQTFEEYRAMVDRKNPERTDTQRIKDRDKEAEQ